MNASLLRSLASLGFVTPRGLVRWARCLADEGVTLMAMLRFQAEMHPDACAVVDGGVRLNYGELYRHAKNLARLLRAEYGLKTGHSVAMLCRNHALSLILLPALSRLGVNVRLLNTDLGTDRTEELLQRGVFRLLVYDEEMIGKCVPTPLPCQAIPSETLFERLLAMSHDDDIRLPRIFQGPALSVMTGGTSGHYTEAPRRPSVTQFLCPFFALLRDVGIGQYDSVCLALPIYHGFGLATLIVGLLMGKKICLMRHFDAAQAMEVIEEEEVEVLPIVPVMLARMLQLDDAKQRLKSLRCIVSGGDRLDMNLIDETRRQLGDIIHNLYGTSEAGFFLLATPSDLSKHGEATLGKPIRGVKCEVRDKDAEGTGTLWVRSGWAMTGRSNRWQSTGDRVWQNAEGYYFHRGRADRLVVCGGENARPDNVERALCKHPDVMASHVYAVPHPDFGQVLNARIELRDGCTLSAEEVRKWLAPRIARAEMPHAIIFGPIKIEATGKVCSQ